MRPRLPSLAAASLGLFSVVACGSHADEPSPIDDPVQFDASETTRAELGIERWGLTNAVQGATVLHGYDAAHRMTLELRNQLTSVDDAHQRIDVELRGEHGTASMSITIAVRPGDLSGALETETAVPSNTFAGNQEARRAVDSAHRDALAAKIDEGGSSGLLVRSSTIRPQVLERGGQELVKDYCARLVETCNQKLLAAEKNVLGQTSACQSKDNTFVARQKCDWLGGNWWDADSCKQTNGDSSACDKTTSQALTDVRLLDDDCKGANSVMCEKADAYGEAEADPAYQKQERERIAHEKKVADWQAAVRKCYADQKCTEGVCEKKCLDATKF